MRRSLAPSLVLGLASCGGWGGGSEWVKEPLVPEERAPMETEYAPGPAGRAAPKTIGRRDVRRASEPTGGAAAGGRVLGTFRNTYYDFPREADHAGAPVPLKDAACKTIANVPRGFFEAVCVQGSGALARGGTVSFAKRDCACAEVCPRTQQRICFDALDKDAFPWGRGAAGLAIAPLRSVAADPAVLPLGTVIYIPELDGVPREAGGGAVDGCFVVEDRGLKVQGQHVDIFTGVSSQTKAINARVPSNEGVTVVLDAPKCAHLARR